MDDIVITSIEEAIASKSPIMIKYNGGSRPGTIRSIIPTKISGDRVFAFCEESGSNKSFILGKILLPEEGTPAYCDHRPQSEKDALNEVYELYHKQWGELGWHVEHGEDYISLYLRYKNGKLRKNPTVEICYDPNNFYGDDARPWCGRGLVRSNITAKPSTDFWKKAFRSIIRITKT